MAEGKCGLCGRPLKDELSIAIGYGPVCWKKIQDSQDSTQKELVLARASNTRSPVVSSPGTLSYSKINRYTTCPQSYAYHYEDGWRTRRESANLKFGSCTHKALNRLFVAGEYPPGIFNDEWMQYKDVNLKYSSRDSWDSLLTLGIAMLELFCETELHKFLGTHATEQDIRYKVGHHEFFGIVDWVGALEGFDGGTIVDFKTASRRYSDSQVGLSDQLTAYFAGRDRFRIPIEQVAFCVLIKTKTPSIQWLIAKRTDEQVNTFLDKVNCVNEQIMQGNIYRSPGMQCDWCDFQPLCLDDKERISNELYLIEDDAKEDDADGDE